MSTSIFRFFRVAYACARLQGGLHSTSERYGCIGSYLSAQRRTINRSDKGRPEKQRSGAYPFNASAPPTIFRISLVMDACRALL
jgi:hypothetical protein